MKGVRVAIDSRDELGKFGGEWMKGGLASQKQIESDEGKSQVVAEEA